MKKRTPKEIAEDYAAWKSVLKKRNKKYSNKKPSEKIAIQKSIRDRHDPRSNQIEKINQQIRELLKCQKA